MEHQRTFGLAFETEALLVDRAVVSTAEQREVRELRGATLRPMADVMALREAHMAAREPTRLVAPLKRAAQRRRDRARARADLHETALRVLLHDHAARVAREAPRRFGRNALAVFQHRVAGVIGVREHGGVDVNDDLLALAGRAGSMP